MSNRAKTRMKHAQAADAPLKAIQACAGASPAASSLDPAFDQVAGRSPSLQSKRNNAMKTMNHVTLTTGHNRVSPRSEVQQDILRMLTPWMLKALADGKPTPLPGPLGEDGFHAHLSVDAGALLCTLFGTQTLPLLTFGVAVDEGQSDVLWDKMCKKHGAGKGLNKPAAPLCAVTFHPGLIAWPDMDVSFWAGDFERCVAWAFIEK